MSLMLEGPRPQKRRDTDPKKEGHRPKKRDSDPKKRGKEGESGRTKVFKDQGI